MNKPPKPRFSLLGFLSPGPDAFDNRRSYRLFFTVLIIGVVIAVAFGFVLYYLNAEHRF